MVESVSKSLDASGHMVDFGASCAEHYYDEVAMPLRKNSSFAL